MAELKVHIQHLMLWELMNNKSATKTAKKISSVYGQRVITDCKVRNWFSKFHSGVTSLRDEPRPGCSSDLDEEGLTKLKNTREFGHDRITYQSTMWFHLKKIWKVCQLFRFHAYPYNIVFFQGKEIKDFSRISLHVTKKGSFITMFKTTGKRLTAMNFRSQTPK